MEDKPGKKDPLGIREITAAQVRLDQQVLQDLPEDRNQPVTIVHQISQDMLINPGSAANREPQDSRLMAAKMISPVTKEEGGNHYLQGMFPEAEAIRDMTDTVEPENNKQNPVNGDPAGIKALPANKETQAKEAWRRL